MIEIECLVNTNLRPTATTDNSPIRSYAKGTRLIGINWVIIPNDVYKTINGKQEMIQKAGDKWLEVTSANGVPVYGCMAVIHKGTSKDLPIIIRDDTVDPPPVPDEDEIIKAVVTFKDGRTEELYPL